MYLLNDMQNVHNNVYIKCNRICDYEQHTYAVEIA